MTGLVDPLPWMLLMGVAGRPQVDFPAGSARLAERSRAAPSAQNSRQSMMQGIQIVRVMYTIALVLFPRMCVAGCVTISPLFLPPQPISDYMDKGHVFMHKTKVIHERNT
jgi:hypothetical protein